MAKGELVLVRAYGGEPATKRVWRDDNAYGGVEVCEEDPYSQWQQKGIEPFTIGWSKRYVFVYHDELFGRLRVAFESQSDESDSLWSLAELYLP